MAESAESVVARFMCSTPYSERAKVLRVLIAHVAAGLVIAEGEKQAAEDVYRVADSIVSRSKE